MKADLINPFLSATLNVLKTMAFTDAQPGKPYVKHDGVASGDVSGIIGITGPPNGSMSLSFTRACILHIVANMLGEQPTEINDEIKDAVGELTNMISGAARNSLGEKGYIFRIASPTVVSGTNHQIKHQSKAATIAIPFDTSAGAFLVEVSFED